MTDTGTKSTAAMFDNKCLKLNVVGTSNLELDQYVMHPHVVIHIVNFENGQYMLKQAVKMTSTDVKQGAYHFENVT